MAHSALRRIGFALAAALLGAVPAAAETGDIASRTLEPVWKTAVPGDSTLGHYYGLRLRVQSDNRVSIAAGYALLTLDAAGKLQHRALLPVRKNQYYAGIPLEGGDFFVQPNAGGTREMRLSRLSADGAVRFLALERLPEDIVSILHDAVLLPDGRITVAASYGPGPNDDMALLVFDTAGRRVGDHRTTIFLPASEGMTRILAQFRDGTLANLSVVGIGSRPTGPSPFRKSFSFLGAVPVGREADFLGTGYLKCSAVNSAGAFVFGVSDAKGEDKRVTLRFYDDGGGETATRTLEEADACQIVLRRDGSSLVWLAPRKVFALDGEAKPLWRAELPEDAVSVGWLSEGDIVAVHAAPNGVNVARYVAH